MARAPKIAEDTNPIVRIGIEVTNPVCIASMSVINPAPATAGIASKNEKRAAALRSRPANKPAVIVIPERDVPGINAITCATPIIAAFPKLIFSILAICPLILSLYKSAIHKIIPQKIREAATIVVVRVIRRKSSVINSPASTIGTVANPIASKSLGFFIAKMMSDRIIQQIARSVPK